MKCNVYDLDNPSATEFYLGVNGVNDTGKTGVDINLKQEYIEVLENAVVECSVRDITTNKIKNIAKPRFRVVKLEKESTKK